MTDAKADIERTSFFRFVPTAFDIPVITTAMLRAIEPTGIVLALKTRFHAFAIFPNTATTATGSSREVDLFTELTGANVAKNSVDPALDNCVPTLLIAPNAPIIARRMLFATVPIGPSDAIDKSEVVCFAMFPSVVVLADNASE
jgi:hypothetical protein